MVVQDCPKRKNGLLLKNQMDHVSIKGSCPKRATPKIGAVVVKNSLFADLGCPEVKFVKETMIL